MAIVCFSAEASFAVGVPLIPAGIYCVWAAALKKPSYLGLAVVPICFGVQQISEGFVWHGLEHGDAVQTRSASLVFLFFALAFWPWWFPVLTTLMEPQVRRKWVMAGLSLLATGWFWVLFYPLLAGQVPFTTTTMHHSIRYEYDDLPIYGWLGGILPSFVGNPRTPLRVLYFLSVALPPSLGSETWGRIPGLVLGASALLAAVVFEYAFVSVWCFFAAALSIYCCVVFYQLPRPTAAPGDSAIGDLPSGV